MKKRLYNTSRWQQMRTAHLRENQACLMCGATENLVVDHIAPHKGAHHLFFDMGNLQTLCKHHHDSDKQRLEARGPVKTIGRNGWPVHPDHPANADMPRGIAVSH